MAILKEHEKILMDGFDRRRAKPCQQRGQPATTARPSPPTTTTAAPPFGDSFDDSFGESFGDEDDGFVVDFDLEDVLNSTRRELRDCQDLLRAGFAPDSGAGDVYLVNDAAAARWVAIEFAAVFCRKPLRTSIP